MAVVITPGSDTINSAIQSTTNATNGAIAAATAFSGGMTTRTNQVAAANNSGSASYALFSGPEGPAGPDDNLGHGWGLWIDGIARLKTVDPSTARFNRLQMRRMVL